MPAFLVRLKKNNEMVGIFSADNEDDLAELVDECTPPNGCEYLELPDGGFYLDGGAVKVPVWASEDGEEIDEIEAAKFFAGASLTDSWGSFFIGKAAEDEGADNQWRSVPHTNTSFMAARLGIDPVE